VAAYSGCVTGPPLQPWICYTVGMIEADAGGQGRLDVRIGFCSETGARPDNEDFAAWHIGSRGDRSRFGVIAAVADGVGGASGGRVAAETAVRGVIEAYLGQNEMLGVRRPLGRAIEAMNGWVHAVGRTDNALSGMACTLSTLVLRGRQAHVAHAGDTRIYRLREDRLVRLTVDHTLGQPGVRHILTRALGAAPSIQIDYAVEAARVHDRYLLCSDGVHGGLSDARLREALQRRTAPEEAAQQIVADALEARIGDNATAVVVDVLDLPPPNQGDLALATAALPILPAPKAGAEVDGFVLGSMLADGRYARVFRARDGAEQRDVIIKFPKPITGAEATLRQAFLRESWIASRIRSPFVAEVLELGEDRRSRLYSVMPYYAGQTLEQRLLRPPRITLAVGLDVAIKLTKAVAALHRAGVIHRDIKPDNIILELDGGLKLVDLGVARLPNMEDFPSPDVPGTPNYMAPEQFAGSAGDERSDIFAAGVTLYRMFSGGAYPYKEVEAFSRPRFSAATPLAAHRPDLPAWLGWTLNRAAAMRREDRFVDMIEFAFELEHGALRAAPAPPRRVPLYERNPLRFWQVVALLLALALAAVLASRVLTGASHPSATPPRANALPPGALAWGFPLAPLLM
jgi:serine/threonine protein phosphatase PrpC